MNHLQRNEVRAAAPNPARKGYASPDLSARNAHASSEGVRGESFPPAAGGRF